MKCNQSCRGFELVSTYPFPTTITITPWAPPFYITHSSNCINSYFDDLYIGLNQFFKKIFSCYHLERPIPLIYKTTRLILLPTCHYYFFYNHFKFFLLKTLIWMTEREISIFEWAIYLQSLECFSFFFFFFFFSSFLFFVVGLFWFSSFSQSVAFFLCSFPLSLHFSSIFSCLVRSWSVAFCFRFSLSFPSFSKVQNLYRPFRHWRVL